MSIIHHHSLSGKRLVMSRRTKMMMEGEEVSFMRFSTLGQQYQAFRGVSTRRIRSLARQPMTNF